MTDVPAEPLDAEHRRLAPRLAAGRAHLPGIHARRVDRARRDAIDADALGAVIDRHRPGQRDDRALRGRIGGEPARAQRRDRRHVDDRAAARGLDHRRDRKARNEEHAVDIDLHDPAPIGDRGIDDAAAPADPDIVVEQVEPAEPGERLVDQRAALHLVDHVGDERRGGAALLGDHRHGLRGGLGHDIDDQHAGAGARQQHRRGAAIADAVIGRAAAGDDRHLARKAEIIDGGLRIAHGVPRLPESATIRAKAA